ncbi:MAG: prolyl oligopeptidase family serine peptidase [Myxococcota bacterium]
MNAVLWKLWLGGLVGCNPPDDGCEAKATSLSCAHEVTKVDDRRVLWQAPDGEAPADGWPVAILFQGSLFPAETYWSSPKYAPFGAYHQVELTRDLLDAGYLVLTPEALGAGLTCWNTNLPGWSGNWESSPDFDLMTALFDAVADGTFGPADPTDWVAAGISSGGYMTSRVANTWPDRFRAVAIASASWETCAGPVCSVPDDAALDAHPPTLFLHGKLDPVVPIVTMWPYQERLAEAGVDTAVEIAPLGLHAWSDDAPAAILGFFGD